MDDLFYAQVIIFVGNIISGLFLAYLSRNMYLMSKELTHLWMELVAASLSGERFIHIPKGFVFTPLCGDDDFEETVTDQRDTNDIKKDA